MRAVRKQAMDGLSGASLRRLRSCGLVPLQEEALFFGDFLLLLRTKESYPHPLGGGSFVLDVASMPCGKKRRDRRRRGRDLRRSYPRATVIDPSLPLPLPRF